MLISCKEVMLQRGSYGGEHSIHYKNQPALKFLGVLRQSVLLPRNWRIPLAGLESNINTIYEQHDCTTSMFHLRVPCRFDSWNLSLFFFLIN